jgi:hypothetical protein
MNNSNDFPGGQLEKMFGSKEEYEFQRNNDLEPLLAKLSANPQLLNTNERALLSNLIRRAERDQKGSPGLAERTKDRRSGIAKSLVKVFKDRFNMQKTDAISLASEKLIVSASNFKSCLKRKGPPNHLLLALIEHGEEKKPEEMNPNLWPAIRKVWSKK